MSDSSVNVMLVGREREARCGWAQKDILCEVAIVPRQNRPISEVLVCSGIREIGW
jgi:hypothetical protein